MSFEQELRDRIKTSVVGSPERSMFKVVLGELQQKSDQKDEVGHAIVKKLVESNNKCLGYLKEDDPRYAQFVRENEILESLLPKYLSVDQIRESLTAAGIDVKSMPEGQAMGAAIKHFKTTGAAVEGQTVKAAVAGMRA